MTNPIFRQAPEAPVIIAGPCMAESYAMLEVTCAHLVRLSHDIGFELVFKASFDKANRTSIGSNRGPGIPQAMAWFQDLKTKFGVRILTDIHETTQIADVAAVCDVLQIPAFLCRQTDLVVAAVRTGRAVNVKKGQFLSPDNVKHLTGKIQAAAQQMNMVPDFAITERGTSFGYGDLIVDMRAFPIMHATGAPLIFDITHSLQKPAAGGAAGEVSGGKREFAAVLARAAAATGYLSGFFLEAHPDPSKALSDAETQLTLEQAETLLRQVVPIWRQARAYTDVDALFRR